MKVVVIIMLFTFLAGCNGGLSDGSEFEPDEAPETRVNIVLVPEQPQNTESYPEAPDDPDDPDEYSSDSTVADDISEPLEAVENDEIVILDILGTADSIYGTRWDSMLAWRERAVELAKEYSDAVIINMNPNDNAVYLTFDDGPDPINTVSVINTLIEYNVSATFFFTGENMRRHRDVVQMAYDAGFAIGLHSYDHPHFTNLSEAEIIEELNVPNDILESIVGSRSYIMRPPFGSADSREIEIIREQGYLAYLWSLDTLDWAQDDADAILQNIKDYLRPGDIILMHAFSGQARSAAILPEIIEFIKSMGLEMRALPVDLRPPF